VIAGRVHRDDLFSEPKNDFEFTQVKLDRRFGITGVERLKRE
jgi:hypothetical protein